MKLKYCVTSMLLAWLLLGSVTIWEPAIAWSGISQTAIECPKCGAIDVTEYDATRLRCNNCGYVFKKAMQ
ncbi:hypothetical protein [Azotosporobacter soli]|uniref:hypothetical protein n=1 Tax=Azotosporobacter soli TaxID=3055040 RepID=UPI0031FEC294